MMVDPDLDIPLDAQRITAMKNLLDEAGIKYNDVPQALPNIVEIKGKGNRTPKSDYLPYVQDFIRSGNYDRDIGDFHNTGLKTLNDAFPEYESLKYFNRANPDKKYVTQQEIDDWNKEWNTPTEGQKSGGVIKMGVGGLLKNAVLAAAREEALSKFPQFRKEIAARQAIEAEYKKAMRVVPYDQQVTLKDWEATRVLPTAERDANLAKFLEESQAKDRLYHATGDDFKAFAPEKTHPESKFGEGIYMTPNTNKANFFANIRTRQGKNAQIMPVYSSVKNPYEIQGVQNIPMNGIDTNKLKSLGYDGVMYRDEAGALQEVVAFEPTQVKSAIGNRGTYDITKPDINEAKGGLTLIRK
jgi:hypothetical protein